MAAEKRKITNKDLLSLSWWAVKFWWKYDTSGFVLYLLSEVYDGLSSVISSLVTGLLVSSLIIAIQKGDNLLDATWWVLVLFGVITFLSFLSAQINRYTTTQRTVRINNILEMLYAQKFKELTLNDVDGREFANKFELAKDARRVLSSRLVNIANLLKYPIVALFVSIPLIAQGYWYVIVLVGILVIPTAMSNASTSKKKIKHRLENIEASRAASETIADSQNASDANKEIKIHGANELFLLKGTRVLIWLNEFGLKFEREWFLQRFFLNIVDTAVYIGVMYAYIVNIGQDVSRLGGILPYTSMVYRVRFSILNFVQQYTTISETIEEIMRVKDFLELKPTELFAKNGVILAETEPSLQVESVTFRYPDTERVVLNNISLSINAGEKVAIVGENGVGKTTLLKLLMGMYKPTTGTIKANDLDIFGYTEESYYENLGVLFQDFPQYDALTVRDNVIAGRYSKTIDDENVIEALKRADAWSFVEKYPKKLDQVLSHRYKAGVSPSTGQWQKLAIARLFYRHPKFVLFDEPTASIDAESEYKIFNEIFSFFKNKTVVIVSHRFSTVRNADKIIVLNDGKIAEQGTHEELLNLKGIYASAYQKQAEGYK